MSNEPETVATVSEWRLTRWQYAGAPLTAEIRTRHDEVSADIDAYGDMNIEVGDGNGAPTRDARIPRNVLVALLRDAIGRGVIALDGYYGPSVEEPKSVAHDGRY